MSLFLMLPTRTAPDADLPADEAAMHSINAANAYSGVSVNSDGKVYWVGDTPGGSPDLTATDKGTYIVGGDTSDFWVRCTGGTNLDAGSDAQSTWYACTSTRSWYVGDTTADDGAETDSFLIEIAIDSSGDEVVASVTYTPSANYSTI